MYLINHKTGEIIFYDNVGTTITGLSENTSYYVSRVDDNQFTNDKKSRNGIWGVSFPGLKYVSKNYEFHQCKWPELIEK